MVTLVAVVPAEAKKRTFELNIQPTFLNPDCFTQSYAVLTVNGQYPAPTVRVVVGDTVEFIVKNSGESNVSTSIHIHGILQFGTNQADGVAGITQVPVAPGCEYRQEFQIVNQTGTFYYHAHVGVQDDSIQGPFIVYEHEESLIKAEQEMLSESLIQEGPFEYHEERILQWSEWWHQSMHDRQAYYMGSNFGDDAGPDSILLNGKSVYENCTMEDCPGFAVIDVKPNSIYRLRNIGGLTFRVLGIFIQHHNMTLIELDGEYVQPQLIDHLELTPGQRSSVLIQTGNYPDGTLFPIASFYKWSLNYHKTYSPNGFGYIRYVSDKTKSASAIRVTDPPKSLPTTTPPQDRGWILRDLKAINPSKPMLLTENPSRTIKLSMAQVKMPDNTTQFQNNGRVHKPWGNDTASLLDIIKADPDPGPLDPIDGFSVKHQTYPVKLGEVIDIVFQNMKNEAGLCVTHPWHTHGYSHYLIAEGPGDYDHDEHKNVFTYQQPLLRDVSMQYLWPDIPGERPCGWIKVRLYAVSLVKIKILCSFVNIFFIYRIILEFGQSIVI